jgi:membrane protein YqaA with SNARE-associated domain
LKHLLQVIFLTLLAWGPWGALALAVFDSLGIPVPGGVDALLITMGAHNQRAGFLAAGLAAIGSTIGSVILFLLARKGGEVYLEARTKNGWQRKFRGWFHHYGALTVLIPALLPVPGLPLKVFVLCAGALGMRPVTFVLIVLCARIVRFFGLAYLGAQMGTYPWIYLKSHAWQLLVTSLFIFLVLYAAVRVKDYLHMRAHHHHLHHESS